MKKMKSFLEFFTEKKEKRDRCLRKADQVYGKKTSAYKSGAVVKCRQGSVRDIPLVVQQRQCVIRENDSKRDPKEFLGRKAKKLNRFILSTNFFPINRPINQFCIGTGCYRKNKFIWSTR